MTLDELLAGKNKYEGRLVEPPDAADTGWLPRLVLPQLARVPAHQLRRLRLQAAVLLRRCPGEREGVLVSVGGNKRRAPAAP